MPKPTSTETEVAVLQVQVSNIETKIDDLREDVRDMARINSDNINSLKDVINENARAADEAHAELNKKIHGLEKWRWMLMGAGVVVGFLISGGFETVAKILK